MQFKELEVAFIKTGQEIIRILIQNSKIYDIFFFKCVLKAVSSETLPIKGKRSLHASL